MREKETFGGFIYDKKSRLIYHMLMYQKESSFASPGINDISFGISY